MRTETLAIVFTDIKGYTAATSSQTHLENARMLKRTERLIEPVLKAYNGQVIKSLGDSYMIVFRSPTEAALCAAAVQDRLHRHNVNRSEEQAIHIRIAMNIGEVRVHRGDVFGEPVNIAARIEGVTPADEIFLSQATYLTMNHSILPTEQVGDFDLKGLPEAVKIYRVKKFAHLNGEEPKDTKELPFGGSQLRHWQAMQWVRRAYTAIWVLAVCGLVAAGYFRYRPSADYGPVLAGMKLALEQDKPTDVIALGGQIPTDAIEERSLSRRYRRAAVSRLIDQGDLDSADSELKNLINEDGTDAEALMYRGMLIAKRGNDAKKALDAISAALNLHPSLGERPQVIETVVHGYSDTNTRKTADRLVETYLKQLAVPALQKAFGDSSGDRAARNAIAQRLEKLGAGSDVDWVALALDDLKSTSCAAKRAAITRLQSEGDERAVGPLLKLGETKGCGAQQAKDAAKAIMNR